jgi:axial budding pattern protein 2
MFFNTKALTVNGVTPSESITLALALHASDQQGYTASTEPFNLVISSHDLSSNTSSLPTINVTASTPFNITLSSPADFTGIYGDGQPLQPSEITDLAIDVSSCKDLKYDNASRTLSSSSEHGLSSGQNPLLPVTIVWSNQTIQTKVSLAVVPSYFLVSSLDPVQASPGYKFQYNLVQEYSNATGYDHDVKLTAAYLPTSVADWLHFDSASGQLTGTMPADFDGSCTHITASFTAYSSITHSTSHTTLPIVVLSSSHNKKDFRGGLSAAAHRRLVLGLDIVFGIVGGVALVGGLLAAFRRCARVEDTAAGGEAGRNVWSDQDKRWYGLEKVRYCS